jgi:hypothetical protein
MNLDLTREQYLTLIECLHLASHIRSDGSIGELEEKMMSIGLSAGLDGMIMDENGKLVLNNLIMRSLHKEVDAYEDDILRSLLADELADRDLRFMKTDEEIGALTDEQYDGIIDSQARRYEAEFAEHGMDHLTLAHELPVA